MKQLLVSTSPLSMGKPQPSCALDQPPSTVSQISALRYIHTELDHIEQDEVLLLRSASTLLMTSHSRNFLIWRVPHLGTLGKEIGY